jgi:AmmeMemoRadiSam system protein A
MEFAPNEQDFLLQVACATIRRRLEGAQAPPMVTPITPNVLSPAGCFVSLHSKQTHALRGCIGRIDSSSPLLMVLGNVAWQVTGDPRFVERPVRLAELPSLSVELSILDILTTTANPLDFDPPNDGLYLIAGGRTGVFLPQVARETGWSREQLLDRLCQEKIGVPASAWRSPGARLLKFKSITIGPIDFTFEDPPMPAPNALARPA